MKYFMLRFLLVIFFFLHNMQVVAQSQEEKEMYFQLYEYVQQISGANYQGGMLLIQLSSEQELVLWEKNNKIFLIKYQMEGYLLNTCTFGQVEEDIYSQMLNKLKKLKGPTIMENFVSSEMTALLTNIGRQSLGRNCLIDIMGVPDFGLLGVRSSLEPPETIGMLDLFLLQNHHFSVQRASRPWLLNAENRKKLVDAINKYHVLEINSIGHVGMVMLHYEEAKKRVSLITWKSDRKIDFLLWNKAKTIIDEEGVNLFPNNSMTTMSTEDEYFKLLGTTAFGIKAWKQRIRQAPHIVFRRWK